MTGPKTKSGPLALLIEAQMTELDPRRLVYQSRGAQFLTRSQALELVEIPTSVKFVWIDSNAENACRDHVVELIDRSGRKDGIAVFKDSSSLVRLNEVVQRKLQPLPEPKSFVVSASDVQSGEDLSSLKKSLSEMQRLLEDMRRQLSSAQTAENFQRARADKAEDECDQFSRKVTLQEAQIKALKLGSDSVSLAQKQQLLEQFRTRLAELVNQSDALAHRHDDEIRIKMQQTGIVLSKAFEATWQHWLRELKRLTQTGFESKK